MADMADSSLHSGDRSGGKETAESTGKNSPGEPPGACLLVFSAFYLFFC